MAGFPPSSVEEPPPDLPSGSPPNSPAPPTDSAPPENPAAEISPPCRFFLEGRCRFGARCHNPHPNDTGSNTLNLEDRRSASEDLPPHPASEKKPAMKTAEDVISRLLWDTQVPAERFTIGYLDRFLGTLEEPFTAFSWEDLASARPGVLAIPKHRIQYFRYGERVVWDKATRTDDVFGSTGSGKTILRVIEEEAETEALREKAQSRAADGEGGAMVTSERTRPAGEEVDNLDSPNDAEEDLDGRAGEQEAVRDLKEMTNNSSCTKHVISDRSKKTDEAGGKTVTSGYSLEEAESSNAKQRCWPPGMAEHEENGTSGSRDGRDFPGCKARPTHFVAIQITNPETREAVRCIQTALCELRPDLAEFCVPLATLHLTLCLLRLDTPEDICGAVAALQGLQASSRRLLPPTLLVSFQGVEAFYPRVLYVRPACAAQLRTLARTLEDAFGRRDVKVIQPPTKETFHLTVAKIRPGKQRPHLPTDCSWVPPTEDFGTQAVEAICLCEIGQGRRTDGFYSTVLKMDLY